MTTRRAFVAAGLAGAAATLGSGALGSGASGAELDQGGGMADGDRTHYELRAYELRSDLDVARARAFFAEQMAPALRRAGAGAVAAFTPDTGLPTPSVVVVIAYPSLAAVGAAAARLAADAPYQAAADAWERGHGLPYVRYDTALYRAFAGHPALERPAAAAPGRVFELRTYEAPSDAGLRAKVAMFNEEEIRIFRASGFTPVFFGEAVAAPRMPHLTYALAFDSMEARAAAWARFGANPDWQRIRVRPGWTDPETVSVIRSAFLRATDFSDVR